MTLLDVIIPSANEVAALQRCLLSLVEQLDPRRLATVVVVDDAAHERDFDAITRAWPQITIIRGERGGPGPARNAGARIGSSSRLLFLDDDMEVTSFDAELISRREILLGRLAAPPDADPWLRRAYRRGSMVASGKAPDDDRLPGHAVSTGALLIDRDVFESLGGYPVTPHGRWEDALFGIAAERAGHNPYVSGRFTAVHHYRPTWQSWLRRLESEGGNLAALRDVIEPRDYELLLAATKLMDGPRSAAKRALAFVPISLWSFAPWVRLDAVAGAAAFARGFRARHRRGGRAAARRPGAAA